MSVSMYKQQSRLSGRLCCLSVIVSRNGRACTRADHTVVGWFTAVIDCGVVSCLLIICAGIGNWRDAEISSGRRHNGCRHIRPGRRGYISAPGRISAGTQQKGQQQGEYKICKRSFHFHPPIGICTAIISTAAGIYTCNRILIAIRLQM